MTGTTMSPSTPAEGLPAPPALSLTTANPGRAKATEHRSRGADPCKDHPGLVVFDGALQSTLDTWQQQAHAGPVAVTITATRAPPRSPEVSQSDEETAPRLPSVKAALARHRDPSSSNKSLEIDNTGPLYSYGSTGYTDMTPDTTQSTSSPPTPQTCTLPPYIATRVPPEPTRETSDLHSISALWQRGYRTSAELDCIEDGELREFYEDQNSQLEDFRRAAEQHRYLSPEDSMFLDKLADEERNAELPTDTNSRSSFECSADGAGLSDLEAGLSENAPLIPTIAACVQKTWNGLTKPLHGEAYVQRAVIVSNVCNVFLVLAQLYAFIQSQSLSMLAVFVDAFLDVVSGAVILFTWWMKRRETDRHKYPVGRERLEPLGVLGLACLMTAATLSSIKEALVTLFGGAEAASFVGMTPVVASVIGLALVTKGALYLYCRSSLDMSVRALAEDHRNDVISNSGSILSLLMAQYLAWWIDPVGGIIISVYIIRSWVNHTLEHVDNLLSKTAPRELINVIVFMACNHSPDLRMVDTVRGYHVGSGIFVEVDIVLKADLPLWRAHDIGESLQVRIEQVEGVERCFVHLDYESTHSPLMEHKLV